VLPGRDMEVIHAETERLTSLIDDLFTLTRAEARQLPLQLTSVDLFALVSRLAETIAPLARRQRSLELVTSLPDQLPLVLADTTRLEQILLNLIQNALRHTPPGGIIAIAAIAMPTMVTISVSDTGEGIAAEDLPFVFERFYRGDSSRSRETGGAGLGLALVRELTEAMDGSVSVESTLGRGSRFTVCLPAIT
jgi:signal transduction histidine kinase